jgi:hypothetical protein
VPRLLVAKEIGVEDVRLAPNRLPERFFEHPGLVVAVTRSRAVSLRAPRHGERVGDDSRPSTMLAARHVAVYVAQIEDARMTDALAPMYSTSTRAAAPT